MKKFKAPGVNIVTNAVSFSNTAASSLIKNDDINTTRVVLKVTAGDKSILSIREFEISSSF